MSASLDKSLLMNAFFALARKDGLSPSFDWSVTAGNLVGWLDEGTRTAEDLVRHRRDWAKWLALEVPGLPEAVSEELQRAGFGRSWWKNGKWHREGGPAVERTDGTREWWREGNLHREDGPAVEWIDGGGSWWKDGKPHREDGPAVERTDGTREWWRNGERHRENGPAIEYPNGFVEWWRNGLPYRETGGQMSSKGPGEFLHGRPDLDGLKWLGPRVADASRAACFCFGNPPRVGEGRRRGEDERRGDMSRNVRIADVQKIIGDLRAWQHDEYGCPDWARDLVAAMADLLEQILSAREWRIGDKDRP